MFTISAHKFQICDDFDEFSAPKSIFNFFDWFFFNLEVELDLHFFAEDIKISLYEGCREFVWEGLDWNIWLFCFVKFCNKKKIYLMNSVSKKVKIKWNLNNNNNYQEQRNGLLIFKTEEKIIESKNVRYANCVLTSSNARCPCDKIYKTENLYFYSI